MDKPALVVIVSLFVSLAAEGATSRADREKRELEMARTSILATLLANKHPQGKYRCAQDQLACIAASPAELGLALIGARTTPQSADALSRLIGVHLDAGLGEDFMCYALERGKSFGLLLEHQDPSILRKSCLADSQAVLSRVGPALAGVDASAVCAEEKEIIRRRLEIISAIRTGSRCKHGDF